MVAPSAVYLTASVSCGGVSWPPGGVATQWLLDGSPIPEAMSTLFVPPRGDDGHQLSCEQTGTTASGGPLTLTSAPHVVHELQAQPSWANTSDVEHCASPVCIENPGYDIMGPYMHAGSWWAASSTECESAPWTSIAGDSFLPAIKGLAEAHTVGMTLERVTATGDVTLANVSVTNLGTPEMFCSGRLISAVSPSVTAVSSSPPPKCRATLTPSASLTAMPPGRGTSPTTHRLKPAAPIASSF